LRVLGLCKEPHKWDQTSEACKSLLNVQYLIYGLSITSLDLSKFVKAKPHAATFRTARPSNLPSIMILQNLSRSARSPLVSMGCTAVVSRVVDEWQGGGGKNPVVLTHVNKASRNKVQCLLDILQRAHDRADNLKPLQCEHQRRRARYDSRVLRQAHRDQRASRPQEARRTLVPPAAWPP
jgi:hypothetical protein